MAKYFGTPDADEFTHLMMPNGSNPMDIGELPEDFGLDGSPVPYPLVDSASIAVDPTPSFALVEFLNIQTDQVFDKVQCRTGGRARQVLKDVVIQMKATYSPAQLYHITGCVRREEEAAKLVGDLGKDDILKKSKDEVMNLAENYVDPEHGSIPIPEIINGQKYLTLRFYVDLGKIYTGPDHPMFKLHKTDTAVRNRFKLRVQLQFLDREPSEVFESPVFRCRTKKAVESNPPDLPSTPRIQEPPSPPREHNEYKNVITESLFARTALIEDLVFGKMSTAAGSMSSPNADIAYHLKIKDEEIEAELEEGDVVGFFTDEDDGGTYVKLLKSNDIENAVHAGVVSRSYYIAANRLPGNEGKTDTVCVIGIVKVKVIGSVENGERVYASLDRPGKAIPQSHLPVGSFLRKKHALLGMSLERKTPKSLEDAQLVECFVCIVLDMGRQDILNEVEQVYELSEKSTQEKIKYASKKAWRKLKCCFASTLVFFLLLAFLLYQVFVPGSMFRYWLCSRGRVNGDLWVSVVPYRSVTQRINVHGIRFTHDALQDKVWEHFSLNNNTGIQKAYYFLNLDRCAYFGDVGPVRNYFNGRYKEIGGGKILSINYNCSTVYWFGLHPNHTKAGLQWYPYVSAKYLECSPVPPYG